MKIKIAVLLAMVIFFACKKEKKEEVQASCDAKCMIKGGKWNLHKLTYEIDGVPGESAYRSCAMDDYTEFAGEGAYLRSDGEDVCMPTTTIVGTWSISGDATVFTKDDIAYEIRKVTEDSLHLYNEIVIEGETTKYYYYYKNIK